MLQAERTMHVAVLLEKCGQQLICTSAMSPGGMVVIEITSNIDTGLPGRLVCMHTSLISLVNFLLSASPQQGAPPSSTAMFVLEDLLPLLCCLWAVTKLPSSHWGT